VRTRLWIISVFAGVVSMTQPARADEMQACIDASDKGQVLRIDRRLREAREQFALCARQECPAQIREACARWLDDAQRAIPRIVFAVKDGDGNDVRAVRITLDDRATVDPYDGTAFALDPGEHTFRFEAAGKQAIEKTYRLVQGEVERQERVIVEDTPRPPAAAPAPLDSVSPGSSSALRTVGLLVAGGGVVGVAVGAALGLTAIAKNDRAHCDANNVCADPQARRDAQGVAAGSTIAFVAGGALALGGLTLFFVAPQKDGRRAMRVGLSPAVSSQIAGFAIGGAW